MVNVLAAVQATALLAAKVRVCTPVPKAMLELSVNANVPMVSEKPVVAPVLNVPPFKVIASVLRILSAADICRIPPVIVVAPLYVFTPDKVKVPVPVLVKAPVLEIIPDKVIGLFILTIAAVVNVAKPELVAAVALVLVRVPLSTNALVVVVPFKSNVAPVLTVAVPVPKPVLEPNLTVPAEIVVPNV